MHFFVLSTRTIVNRSSTSIIRSDSNCKNSVHTRSHVTLAHTHIVLGCVRTHMLPRYQERSRAVINYSRNTSTQLVLQLHTIYVQDGVTWLFAFYVIPIHTDAWHTKCDSMQYGSTTNRCVCACHTFAHTCSYFICMNAFRAVLWMDKMRA